MVSLFQVDALDLEQKLVADSGSLRLAYSVYRDFLSERAGAETHTVLPAINLTEPQLFFLSYAQVSASPNRAGAWNRE